MGLSGAPARTGPTPAKPRPNPSSTPAQPPARTTRADFAREVLQFQSTSSKLARVYCTFGKTYLFNASTTRLSLRNKNPHATSTVASCFPRFANRISDMQIRYEVLLCFATKMQFRIGVAAFFKLGCLQAL